MSRRRKADKRDIIPDPKFGDVVLTKFMNSIMQEGKKSVAERIVYGALDQMEKKTKQNPVDLFHEALRNVMPALEVRSRRVGGAKARQLIDEENEALGAGHHRAPRGLRARTQHGERVLRAVGRRWSARLPASRTRAGQPRIRRTGSESTAPGPSAAVR